MFLLVPAHPGFPEQIPQSRKTVVVVVVVAYLSYLLPFSFFILTLHISYLPE